MLKKNNKNVQNVTERNIAEDGDYQDLSLERRYPFPGRKLPTTIDWDRLGPTTFGTSPPNRRRHRRRLIPISNETRERIISELRARGVID